MGLGKGLSYFYEYVYSTFLGREAVKLLLHNARRYRRQENAVLYIKFGDYNQAVRDFYSVKPRFIKNTKQTDAGAKTTVSKI